MKDYKIHLSYLLAFSLLFSALANLPLTSLKFQITEFVPGEVIVGFEEMHPRVASLLESEGYKVKSQNEALDTVVVSVPVGKEDEYIRRVSHTVGVKFAEKNGIVHGSYVPSDPDWSLLWNMRTIEADNAWDIHQGSHSILLAILDSGVDYNHLDLQTNYVAGGFDWVNSDNDPMDDHSHGTHVAGIAAASIDDVGVVGVAQVSIWAEKVLNSTNKGTMVDLANGITHAADNGVDVISMSLGGVTHSSLVDKACSYAWNMGVLLVAAAGNDNQDIDLMPYFPASLPSVVAVSATTSGDVRWASSNFGNTVELSAPGASVYSTMPGDSYGYKSGTSMACPHVSGVAALVWSYYPSLTNSELRHHLHYSIDDLGDPGKDALYGYGRINAYTALTVTPPQPPPPTDEDLIIDFYPDVEATYAALKGGEVDLLALTGWSAGLPLHDGSHFLEDLFLDATEDPNIQLAPIDGNDVVGFDFNNNWTIPQYPGIRSPMSYLSFRQALARLVDKDLLASLSYFARRIDVPIPSSQSEWWNPDVTGSNYPYEYNPVVAATILDASGFIQGGTPNPYYDVAFPASAEYIRTYPAGHQNQGQDLDPIIFKIRKDDTFRLIAGRYLAELIRRVGIPVLEVEEFTEPHYIQVMQDRDYHIYTSGWAVKKWPIYLYKLYHSDFWHPYGSNYVTGVNGTGFVNFPVLDFRLEQLGHSPNYSMAHLACNLSQQIMINECISVWLYSTQGYVAYRNLLGVANMDGYGLVNEYTFFNARRADDPDEPIRVGLINNPVSLNVMYSSWIYDWIILDRIYSHLLNEAPYVQLYDQPPFAHPSDQPWLAKDWEVRNWTDPQDGNNKTMVTYWLRENAGWANPVTGEHNGWLTSQDVEFSIWFTHSFSNSWHYNDVMDVHHTKIVDDSTIEVYFDTSSQWAVHWTGEQLPILPRHLWIQKFCIELYYSEILIQSYSPCDMMWLPNPNIVQVVDVTLDGLPLVENVDFEIITTPDNTHNWFHWLTPAAIGQNFTIRFWTPVMNPSGFTPGSYLWWDILEGCGSHYIVGLSPGEGGSISFKKNPNFFLETPPLGEIDFVYKWNDEPKPRGGCYKIFIFDVVMAAMAYGSQGNTVPDSQWYPGADLAPPGGVIDIFDIVTVTGKYSQEWSRLP